MELSTNYMGLALRNPLVASPSPLSYSLDGIRRLADGGVASREWDIAEVRAAPKRYD